MLIQDLVDTKDCFDAKNWPKDITSYEENYEVKKAILEEIVRK